MILKPTGSKQQRNEYSMHSSANQSGSFLHQPRRVPSTRFLRSKVWLRFGYLWPLYLGTNLWSWSYKVFHFLYLFTIIELMTNQSCHVPKYNIFRIKMDVSQNHCGLIISDSLSDDNGQWECRVTASATTQYK